MKRLALVLITVGIAAGAIVAGSSAGGRQAQRPAADPVVDPQVAMGAHLFVQFACSACHGYNGQGGPSKAVPPLRPIAKVLTPARLRSVINRGMGDASDTTRPYMPAWGPVISDTQVADLVAFIKAGLPPVEYAVPIAIPTRQGTEVAGMRLYQRYGCGNCHGFNGLGGVPNPKAAARVIPPLTDIGKKYSNAQIMEIVRTGRNPGIGSITGMPHWGGIIPDDQIADIVDYLKTFR